jgi:hypothetical protein
MHMLRNIEDWDHQHLCGQLRNLEPGRTIRYDELYRRPVASSLKYTGSTVTLTVESDRPIFWKYVSARSI